MVDDLHELTWPEALTQLTRLLTSLPPQVHAILATRHDVQPGLHLLRMAGELAEIRAADLRFSEREARELLDASGIKLSDAGVALLYQRTEGWAAGLRLAAISLAGHPDPERFVTVLSGIDRMVAAGEHWTTCHSGTGNVDCCVPGVRANSLISCASASLTGWSRGGGEARLALALAGAPPGQRDLCSLATVGTGGC